MYILYADSILNDETQKSLMEKELQFDYEKKSSTDSVNYAKEKELKAAQISEQKIELKAKKKSTVYSVCRFIFIHNFCWIYDKSIS